MLKSYIGWFRNFAFQFGRCHTAVKPEFESLRQEVKHKNVDIWRWNVDFKPKLHFLWSERIILCDFVIFPIESRDVLTALVASHVTDPGSLLPTRALPFSSGISAPTQIS